MIDDFQVPDDPGYAYDDYGPGKALTPDLVDPACRRLRNLGIKGSMGGVFIIFRPTAPHMMTTVLKTPSCSRFCFLTRTVVEHSQSQGLGAVALPFGSPTVIERIHDGMATVPN